MRKDIFEKTRRLRNLDVKVNISETAKQLGCDWRTAKKYLNSNNLIENNKKRKNRKTKIDDFKDIIKDKYLNCNATGYSIYIFIKDKGYSGGYTTVQNYIRLLKDEKSKKASIRFETKPGEQAQVDWKEELKLISKNRRNIRSKYFLYSSKLFKI